VTYSYKRNNPDGTLLFATCSGLLPGDKFVQKNFCAIVQDGETPRLLRGDVSDVGELVAMNLANEVTEEPNYTLGVIHSVVSEQKKTLKLRILNVDERNQVVRNDQGTAQLEEVVLDVDTDTYFIVQPLGREAYVKGEEILVLLQAGHTRKLAEDELRQVDEYFDEMTFEDEPYAIHLGKQLPEESGVGEVANFVTADVDFLSDRNTLTPRPLNLGDWDTMGRALYRIKLMQKRFRDLQDSLSSSGQGSAHASETGGAPAVRSVDDMQTSGRRDSLSAKDVRVLAQGVLASDVDSPSKLLNAVPEEPDLPGILITYLEDDTDAGWACVALAQMMLQDTPIASQELEAKGVVAGQPVQVFDSWTLEKPYVYADLGHMLVASGCRISEQLDFEEHHTNEMIHDLKKSAACTEPTDPMKDLFTTPQRLGFVLSFKKKNKRQQPELVFLSTVKTMLYAMPQDCAYADAIVVMHPRHDCVEVVATVAEAIFWGVEKFTEVEHITRVALPPGKPTPANIEAFGNTTEPEGVSYLKATLSEEIPNSGAITSYQKFSPDQQVTRQNRTKGDSPFMSIIPVFKTAIKCEKVEFRFEVVQGMRVSDTMHRDFPGTHRFVCMTWVGQWHATYMAIHRDDPTSGQITFTMFQAPALLKRELEMKRKEKFAGRYPYVRITKRSGAKAALEGVVTRLVREDDDLITREEVEREQKSHAMFQKVLARFWKKIDEETARHRDTGGGKFEARKWCLADSQFKAGAKPRVVGKMTCSRTGGSPKFLDSPTAGARKPPSTTKTPVPERRGKGSSPEVSPAEPCESEDTEDEEIIIDAGRGRGNNKQTAPEAVAMAQAAKVCISVLL